MQKKLYRMEDETLEVMHEFMQSRGFYSETQAIERLAEENHYMLKSIIDALEED